MRIQHVIIEVAAASVRELGDTRAVAKEGSAGTKIWVVLRYDWKQPGMVHWSLVDSNFCDGGTGDITITPGVGGGSRVDVEIPHIRERPVPNIRLAHAGTRRSRHVPEALAIRTGPASR